MGNRATVVFVGSDTPKTGAIPAVYLHWGGVFVREWLEETRKLMEGRQGDAQAALARFVGVACAHTPPPNSVYMDTVDRELPDHSCPGDAGVFVVDLSGDQWKVANQTGRAAEGAFSGIIGEDPEVARLKAEIAETRARLEALDSQLE